MQIIFLGTSSMVPTKERNHSAIFFKYKNEGILFDCGEGTQRQLKIAEIKPSSITKIIISHWHGDHVLGIPGLLQTLASSQYSGTIKIYGPKGTKANMKKVLDTFIFDNRLDMNVYDITKKRFIDTEDYFIEAYELEHQVKCLGFRLVEKDRRRINIAKARKLGLKEGPLLGRIQQGKSIKLGSRTISPDDVSYVVKGRVFSYVSDTRLNDNCMKIAKDADVLVCESTYLSDQEEKAEKYFHLTSKQAAFIAHQASAKKLILTHFSQRYKEIEKVLAEANDIFPNTIAAYDFMKIKI